MFRGFLRRQSPFIGIMRHPHLSSFMGGNQGAQKRITGPRQGRLEQHSGSIPPEPQRAGEALSGCSGHGDWGIPNRRRPYVRDHCRPAVSRESWSVDQVRYACTFVGGYLSPDDNTSGCSPVETVLVWLVRVGVKRQASNLKLQILHPWPNVQ